jgi:hypothetical protein
MHRHKKKPGKHGRLILGTDGRTHHEQSSSTSVLGPVLACYFCFSLLEERKWKEFTGHSKADSVILFPLSKRNFRGDNNVY